MRWIIPKSEDRMTELETLELETEEPTVEQRAIIERADRNGHRALGEPLVYAFAPRGESYFRDMALQVDGKDGAPVARERLERHRRQMEDVPKREKRELGDLEYRVNPNLEAGHGQEFTIPFWMNELFATARRPGQVLQKLARTFDLPLGVSSVNLPRITQGTTASQSGAGTPIDDQDVETAAVSSPASTFTGLSDWAMQVVDMASTRAALDWVVGTDLMESVDAEAETAMIVGTGKNEQFYGLINVPGINTITYTSGSPTATGMFPYLGQTAAQVGVKRRQQPKAWLMTTSRFFWIATSEDTSNRPLSIEDYPLSDFPRAGLSSLGVYDDNAIPTNLGENKEQDVVIACCPNDFIILLGEPKVDVLLETLSGTLTARFAMRRYIAAILGRFPRGISVLSGTGMTVQSGFN
jgi:HK97 family phage major capsid protein